MRSIPALAVAVAVILPVSAFAVHQLDPEAWTASYPFQAQQDQYLGFQWVGIGGGGAPGTFAPQGTNNLGPAPDDCFDADNYPGTQFLKVTFPGVSVQTAVERETLVPGQSVDAPAELIALCSTVREIVFGQASGYAYANDPASIGFGDLEVEVAAVVSSAGFFDDALAARPSSLLVDFCLADPVGGFAPTGTESLVEGVFNNGAIVDPEIIECRDLTGDYLQFLVANPDAVWTAGQINRLGGGNVYRQSVAAEVDGLYIVCFSADLYDAANALVGRFQDYSYYWIDNVDGNVVGFWTDPLGHTDGWATSQDCSEVGIPHL